MMKLKKILAWAIIAFLVILASPALVIWGILAGIWYAPSIIDWAFNEALGIPRHASVESVIKRLTHKVPEEKNS